MPTNEKYRMDRALQKAISDLEAGVRQAGDDEIDEAIARADDEHDEILRLSREASLGRVYR